jgi:hypothetical protein
VLDEAQFQAGNFDTDYVAAHSELLDYKEENATKHKAAAIAAALAAAGLV